VTIYFSNVHDNGLGIRVSRFNHSCCRNALLLWNEDTKTYDVRALETIKQGEEISISYNNELLGTRGERRERYDFDCRCEACNMSEEESETEDQMIAEYIQVKKQSEGIRNSVDTSQDIQTRQALLKEDEECRQKLLLLSEKIKTIPAFERLDNIRELYKLSCIGMNDANTSNSLKTAEIVWSRKTLRYLEMLVSLVKTMSGEEHSNSITLNCCFKNQDAYFRKLLRE